MKIYIVNAFARGSFSGNPAAVVPLQEWLPEERMQAIAAQNNLSETAFTVPQGSDHAIRWFTPTVEVSLCGHATLATAHVFFNHLSYSSDRMRFHSQSGVLEVYKGREGGITLDFPSNEPQQTEDSPLIEKALKVKPLAVYKCSFDYMAVLENQQTVENLSPDLRLLATLPDRGLITTAKGEVVDFVSRCFYPQYGIDEDPVTGSAHTVMAPYWAKQLGKKRLSAIQLSQRKGWLDCEWAGDRVLISGKAITYLEGTIFV